MDTNDTFRLLLGIFLILLATKGVKTHLVFFFSFLTLLTFIYDYIDHKDQPPQRQPLAVSPLAGCSSSDFFIILKSRAHSRKTWGFCHRRWWLMGVD